MPAVVIFFVLCLFFFLIWPVAAGGAPFVPTDQKKIKSIIGLAKLKPGEQVADIGSGDGRLAIAFARADSKVVGYEINPILVWWSKYLIYRAKLQDKIKICRQDYWSQDLSPFNVVVVFGAAPMMARLAKKLHQELKPDARVISNGFKLPEWPVTEQRGEVYLYIKK